MPKATDQQRKSSGATSIERGRSARAKLLAAAAALIAEVGWNAVSTRLLADRAGVRSGLVHYHFESLQTVLRRAALGEMTVALEQAKAAFAEQSSGAALTDAMLAETGRVRRH